MNKVLVSSASPADEPTSKWCLGVPYSFSRPMNDEQLTWLQRMFRIHTILLAASVLVFLSAVFASEYLHGTLRASIATIGSFALALGVCDLRYWIPLFKSLRLKTIDVYVGKQLPAWENDRSQTFLTDQYSVNTEQSIRFYVGAGGNVLFQVNDSATFSYFIKKVWFSSNIPSFVYPCSLIIPDKPSDSGELYLNSRERRELRKHIVRCCLGQLGNTFVMSMAILWFGLAIYHFKDDPRNPISNWVPLIIWGIAALSFMSEFVSSSIRILKLTFDWLSRRPLLMESEDSTHLRWSRILWTEDGRPASWRLSRAFKWKPAPPRRYS